MKFKRLFAFILSASMLACLSACGDDTENSSGKGAEIATETVAVESEISKEEAEESALNSAKDKMESEISRQEAEESALNSAKDKMESEISRQEAEESALNSAKDKMESNQSISDLAKNYDNEHPENTIIPMLQMGFETTFKDSLEIKYDEAESNYIVNVWMDGFADMLKYGDYSTLDSTCKSLEPSFKTMVDTIRRLDSDANMTFNFVNDKDKKEIFFTFYNDKMTYCISDDK